jgi:Zn ribbon nucleic-acid-binding protein
MNGFYTKSNTKYGGGDRLKVIEIFRKTLKEKQISRIKSWIIGWGFIDFDTQRERKPTDGELLCPKCQTTDHLILDNAWLEKETTHIKFIYVCKKCGFRYEDSIIPSFER